MSKGYLFENKWKNLLFHGSLLTPYITIAEKDREMKICRKVVKKQIAERKVIAELQKNARESMVVIAEKCGLSRQRVWRIIERLEENKTIWRYNAVVDKDKLGVEKYLLLLKRTNVPISKEIFFFLDTEEVKQETSKIGVSVDYSFFVHGSFDLVVGITVNNVKQMKQFCEMLRKLFAGYISTIETLDVLFTFEESGIGNPNPEGINDFFLTENEVNKNGENNYGGG